MTKTAVKSKENLKRILSKHLENFEKLNEWTDLANWLQNCARYIEGNPTKYIPERKTLAKRLSQCLNESYPIGIHKTTLNIYQTIFEQIKDDKKILTKQIPFYCFGLFPFFAKSSLEVI